MKPYVSIPRMLALRSVVLVAACALSVGCGSEKTSPFERFERLPTIAELVTVDLGEYHIPVPVEPTAESSPTTATQVQIEFRLHAAVLPQHEATMISNFERLEGRLRDRVIHVCRHASAEELLDPELSTLKTELSDSLKPFIGNARIERLHIEDPQVRRL
jgi:flagellar basal body-associated protein FliL